MLQVRSGGYIRPVNGALAPEIGTFLPTEGAEGRLQHSSRQNPILAAEPATMSIILCDIDGTLLSRNPTGRPGEQTPKRVAINRALAEEFGLPDVDFRQGIEHGLTDWRIAENAVRCHRPEASIDGAAWQRVCARAEGAFVRFADGDPPHYAALPGVPASLEALRAAGHTLGVVTGNVSFFAVDKLAHAGIDPALFAGPRGFGDHGRERHHIIRLAAAQAGDEPLVVLGDTRHDLAGAREAGLPFLGVGTTGLSAADLDGHDRVAWLADLADATAVVAAVGALTG
ncbi:HAD hydrolase-like protein [bacterium]|nr:HAD hydrolase-like protein [bacterium]